MSKLYILLINQWDSEYTIIQCLNMKNETAANQNKDFTKLNLNHLGLSGVF